MPKCSQLTVPFSKTIRFYSVHIRHQQTVPSESIFGDDEIGCLCVAVPIAGPVECGEDLCDAKAEPFFELERFCGDSGRELSEEVVKVVAVFDIFSDVNTLNRAAESLLLDGCEWYCDGDGAAEQLNSGVEVAQRPAGTK